MSASKSVHTYSFSLKSTDKFGLQVGFNFGLGEGELHISQMLTLMPVKKGALEYHDHSFSYSHLYLRKT